MMNFIILCAMMIIIVLNEIMPRDNILNDFMLFLDLYNIVILNVIVLNAIILNVDILNVIILVVVILSGEMLNVSILSVIILTVDFLNVILLIVVRLKVAAPCPPLFCSSLRRSNFNFRN